MSAPVIISSSPSNGTAGVVLGTPIVVGFDQMMDTTTLTEATFVLTGPGQTAIIAPSQLIAATPNIRNGREYITGTFSFSTGTNNNTILTFVPSVPLRPNVTYEILVIGPAALSSASAKNTAGEALAKNYKWSFTTGDLNVSVPPAQSPLPLLSIPMDPSQIRISQQIYAVGNDLAQEITLVFPGVIDPTSVNVDDILLSIEPILNDPFVKVPPGLTRTVTISSNTITILVGGWPNPDGVSS